MDFESALKYLEGFTSYEKSRDVKYDEKNFDLRRVRDFLEVWGVDYSGIDFVHVAGSKGKGTVCNMIARYLWEKNEKAGLYTSPHILDVRERIQINGMKISERLFGLYMADVKKVLDRHKDFYLTYFEVLTVLALKFFVDENVRYAVMEVGLGGRLDATNIISPEVAVLTRIEKEHTDILGDDIENIIYEKLGIMKEGVPLVVGSQSKEVYDILKRKLRWRKNIYFVDEKKFDARDEIKRKNGAVALSALKILTGSVDKNSFSKMVDEFALLGRFDLRIVDGKEVVFDVAHTPASMKVLAKSLKENFPGKDFVFLISVLKDKRVEDIFEVLSEVTGTVVFTTLPILERSIGRTDFEEMKIPFWGEIVFKADCKEAFFELLNKAKSDQVIVVTGSHFLVAEILKSLRPA